MTDQRTTTTATVDGAAEAVAAVIGRLGGATAAATARDIATEAAVAYSTTNKKLRLLRDVGWAESFDNGDGRTVWRLTAAGVQAAADAEQADPDPDGGPTARAIPPQPGRTAAGGTTDEVDQPTDAATDTEGVGDGTADEDTTTAARDPQPVAPDPQPVAPVTDAEPPAKPAELDKREAPPVPAAAEGTASHEGTATPGDDTDGVGTEPGEPAAALPAAGPVDADPPGAEPAGPTPTEAAAAPKPRRASGTLDGAVMDILEADPDGQFKVGQLCKLIDKANEGSGAAKASPGAVVLACQRLERKGKAALAVERPATYRLAPPTT